MRISDWSSDVCSSDLAVPGLLDETHAMLMRCDGALFAEQQAAAAGRPDYRASLAAVSAPTLILAGEEDRIVAPDRSREIAAAIAHADLCLVPACGQDRKSTRLNSSP